MRRFITLLLAVIVAVGLLGLASYITTFRYWDGGYPAGEVRLKIVNGKGEPIKGAVLRVYRGTGSQLSFEYPVCNFVADHDLVSDENGQIIAIQPRGGFQFGGEAWDLFWLIPIGHQPPKYECEIRAENYQPCRFPVGVLFESPHQSYEEIPKTMLTIRGKDIELPIYESTVTLR
jgi:hypothetical protein